MFIAAAVIIIAYGLLAGISIMTMQLGWGLEAKNWGWIAFGYLAMFSPALLSGIADRSKR